MQTVLFMNFADLKLRALKGIPMIRPNDNIAEIVCLCAPDICDNDIFVIASTIISKAQNCFFSLENIVPGPEALRIAALNGKDPRFVQAVLDQSDEMFVETPFMLVRTKNGNICVNAGIDGSNVEGDLYITLPSDPDKAAKDIGMYIYEKTGKKTSVIISDTNGRAFKTGQTNIAIGLYGIDAIRDWVGSQDLFGFTLEVSREAVVDEIAGAANLLMGEGSNGLPVIQIRGLSLYTDEPVSARTLFRPEKEDIIIKGLRVLKK